MPQSGAGVVAHQGHASCQATERHGPRVQALAAVATGSWQAAEIGMMFVVQKDQPHEPLSRRSSIPPSTLPVIGLDCVFFDRLRLKR